MKEKINAPKSDRVQIYPVVHVYNDDGTNEDMLKCPGCGSSEEVRFIGDPAEELCNEDGSPLSLEQISCVLNDYEHEYYRAWCERCGAFFNPYNHLECTYI